MFPSTRPLSLKNPQLAFTRWVRHQSNAAHSFPRSSSSKLRWLALGTATSAIAASSIYYWSSKSTLGRWTSLPLSPTYFSPTTLLYSEKTSESTRLIKLSLPPAVATSLKDDSSSIWSIYVKDSDIQVERPYTPLEGLSEDGSLFFWIRKYRHGEVGRWIHSKLAGDQIEIRGPVQTWPWEDGKYSDVIMLAGGTGIAPFYQLLHHHFSERKAAPKAKFTLIHGHREPSELPPAQLMDQLRTWERSAPENLRIYNLVDSLGSLQRGGDLIEGRISEDLIRSVFQSCTGKTIVLVCGPDSMINAVAGSKARDQSQGPLGGMLARLKTDLIDVWKL